MLAVNIVGYEPTYQVTLEVLYTMGNCDPFHTNADEETVFHAFLGLSTAYNWLKQQEQLELASLSTKETYDLQAHRIWPGKGNLSSVIQDLFPRGIDPHEMANYIVECGYLRRCNLLHVLAIRLADDISRGINIDSGDLEELQSVNMIIEGSDVDNINPKDLLTPISSIVRSALYSAGPYRKRVMKQAVRFWLRLLGECGIDLEKYGEGE